ncbi:hypothetical protein GQ600_16552 [Phytophthora cactorum]|nr:hypothetical protein GQ600_16552 [Phytophthora cactorum]
MEAHLDCGDCFRDRLHHKQLGRVRGASSAHGDGCEERLEKWWVTGPHHQLDEEAIHAQASEISALVQIGA